MNIGVWILVGVAILLFTVGCSSFERKLLYFPTHHDQDNGLEAWTMEGVAIGFARKVDSPQNVWLMLHGNGGQAADRVYALPRFSADDSVYILEYPGYGERPGRPSKKSFNEAAQEAYHFLRKSYPSVPVCVVGESIGTGPASFLGSLANPPDKIALAVPFGKLAEVAKESFPSFVVSMVLSADWDNAKALSDYQGPIDIYGAQYDTIIPVSHAKALAGQIPQSKFILLECGHNEWSYREEVRFRNP